MVNFFLKHLLNISPKIQQFLSLHFWMRLVFLNNRHTISIFNNSILYFICFVVFLSLSLNPIQSFSQSFRPTDIPNLKFWVASDTAITIISGGVQQWNDISGNNKHLIQNTQASRPIKTDSVLNNKPVIRFDGINDFMKVNFSTSYNVPNTIFILYKIKELTGNIQIVFDGYDGTNRNFLYWPAPPETAIYFGAGTSSVYTRALSTNYIVTTIKLEGSNNRKLYENGLLRTPLTGTQTGTNPITGFTIGSFFSGADRFFRGDIAEIIFYNSLLSDSLRSIVEQYLWNKYFPPVNLGPDIYVNYGFCPNVTLNAGNNFNTYLWSNTATSSSTIVNSESSYWVSVTDNFNNISKDTIKVFFPQVHVPDTTICYGDTIRVSPNMQGYYTYLWNTNETTSQIQISHAGQYWVKVIDTTANHCFKIDTFNIAVDSLPYYVSLNNHSNDTLDLCIGNTLFLATGAQLVTNYLWQPGGETSPTITINNTGWNYVIAGNNYGCTKTDSVYVYILGTAPVPNFSVDGYCSGDSVYFTDLSTCPDSINYHEWIITGLDTLYQKNPAFLFNAPGIYTLKYTVGSISGCQKDTTTTIEIKQGIKAGYLDLPLCNGTPSPFTDTSHIPIGETLQSRAWYNNSVFQGALSQLTLTPITDTLKISLSLLLTNGCSDSISKSLPVAISYLQPAPFSLITPAYNQTLINNILTFTWHPSTNAIKYKLLLASDLALTDTIYFSDFIYSSSSQQINPLSHQYTNTSSHQILYWKVIAYNPCNLTIQSPIYKFFTQPQLGNPNLKFWVAADTAVVTNNDTVLQWNDISGNNKNLLQSIQISRPVLTDSVLNHKPVICFDGINDFLNVNFNTTYNIPNTFFVVYKFKQPTGNIQTVYDGFSGTNRSYLYWPALPTSALYFGAGTSSIYTRPFTSKYVTTTIELEGADNRRLYENGILRTPLTGTQTGVVSVTGLTIGSFYTGGERFLNGDIAEFLFYNTILADSNKIAIENYLMNKYAPPLYLGQDIYMHGFCDTLLTADTAFSTFIWSTGSDSSSTVINHTGTYSLTVTDIFGRTSVDSLNVFYPDFNINDTIICLGDTINVCTGLTADYTYLWSNGSNTPCINISTEDLYRVTVTGSGVCFRTDSFFVNVDSLSYYAKLSNDTLHLCSGNTIALLSGASLVSNYLWSPGDDTTNTIYISQSALYKVTVSNAHCVTYDSVYVDVYGTAPVPNFSFDGFCSGDSVYFTDLSTCPDSINYHEWIITGLDTLYQKNPVFLFNSPGIYSLKYTVGSISGCQKDTTTTIQIKQGFKAGYLDLPLCNSTPFPFTDTSHIPIGETLQSRAWYNNSVFQGALSQLNLTPITDTINLSLSLMLTNGCSDSITKALPVAISYPQPAPFSLITPAYNQTLINNNLTFTWQPSANAIKYKLLLASNQTLTDTIYLSDFIYSSSSQQINPLSHQYTNTSSHQILFWKVIAYNPCNLAIQSPIYKFFTQPLLGNPNLKFWIAADTAVVTNNDTVLQWNDISGNNKHLLQSIQISRPVLTDSALNHKPVIRFDGINDFLNVNFNTSYNIPNTFFIVYKFKQPTGNIQTVYDGFSGTNRSYFYWPALPTSAVYFGAGTSSIYTRPFTSKYVTTTIELEGADNRRLYENGILRTPLTGTQTGVISVTGLTIGAFYTGGDRFLNGDIAEFLFYNTILADSNKIAVENYLMNKYAPPLYLGQDIYMHGFCDTILTADTAFSTFIWSTGSDSGSTVISHTGTYSLTVTDIFGRTSVDSINVFYPEFNINDTIICLGNTINVGFEQSSTYSFLWNTGDTTPSININTAGTFWVNVSVPGGCFQIDTFNVNVDSLAYFLNLGSDISLCIGNKIFVSQGNAYATYYFWTPTNDTTPQTIINQEGMYILQATSPNMCIAYDSIYAPAADTIPLISFSVTGACLNDSIHFADLSQSTSAINYWNWNIGTQFNDGSSDFLVKFDTAGFYSLMLTVANTSACITDTTAYFEIKPAPQSQIISYPACEGVETKFEDISIVPAGYVATSRQWFISGLPSGNQSTLYHTFDAVGTYAVGLETTIDNFCSDYLEVQINIQNNYPIPQNFTLVSPADSINLATDSCLFVWNQAPNAIKYKLYLATDSNFTNILYQSDFIYPYSFSPPSPISLFLSLSAASSPFIFWKVNAYNPCNDSTPSATQIFYQFNPIQISNLKLWTKGDTGVTLDNNGGVSQWNDLSGNHFNFIQGNVNKRPTKVNNQLYKYPVLRFDGNNDFMKVDFNTSYNLPYTIFILYNFNVQTGTYQLVYDGIDGINRSYFYWSQSPISSIYFGAGTSSIYSRPFTTDYIVTSIVLTDSINRKLYENGNQRLPLTGIQNGINPITGLTIGSFYTGAERFLKGDIAEIIFYDTLLADTQRLMVEKYLMDKYAPPVNLGPDINITYSVCDTSLSAGTYFTNYLWSTGDTISTIPLLNSGTYWVQVTDVFGRISSDTVIVNLPEFHFNDTIVCLNSYAIYNVPEAYQCLWSDNSTADSAMFSSEGNYWVQISDTLGNCSRVYDFFVTVDNFAQMADLGPDKTMCSGALLGLNTGANEATSYFWSTGESVPYIVISDTGLYTLDVWNNIGCRKTDTIHILLNGFLPVADFMADSVCVGNTMNFTDLTTDYPADTLNYYFWNFGNFQYVTGFHPNPIHTFFTPGNHDVKLIVRTSEFCTDTIIKSVLVYDKPVPDFTPELGCMGVSIEFKDFSTVTYGTVSSWLWTFGDDSVSTLQSPLHAYNAEGDYEATLISKSSHNCADSLKKTVYVRVGPDVDFVHSNACFGEEIQFTNNTQTSPWTQVFDQSWDFGDGSISPLINPKHIYADMPGNYNVTLTVKSINGCIVPKTKLVKVNSVPIANFLLGSACANTPFNFYDISTVDNDSIVQWHWNFGNLATDSVKDPFFTFPVQGSYTVSLDVTSSSGCKNFTEYEIEVFPSPTASFTLTPQYGISPLTVFFTNHSTPANLTYVWNFGDYTSQSLLEDPTHTYYQNGIYNVQLTAMNTYGCQNTYYDMVNVIPTVIDIEVGNVNVEINDNYIGIKSTIKNIGTQTIEKMDLFATSSNGMVFREMWNGRLYPGESMEYPFTAQFLLGDESIDYVCVKALPITLENDVDLSNNESCMAVTENFTAINTFPNPAYNEININIIIPTEDIVEITMYNANGELVANIFNGSLSKGLSRFKVNIDGLKKGMYTYKVTFNSEVLVKKFIKM